MSLVRFHDGRSMRIAVVAMVVIAAAMTAAVMSPAMAAVRVHMVDGRVLDAMSCRIESGIARVDLDGGASLGFPSSRIARVEALTSAQETLAAAPHPIAAPTADPSHVATPPAAGPQAMAVAPEPAAVPTIDALIRRAAERHQLEADLLAAVIAVESGYRAGAVSPKGAQGLMQLMPATARELDVVNPFDPEQNIEGGARYLRQMLDLHGDSYVRALAAYNAGRGRVARYNGLPPYRETIQYIDRVLKQYRSTERSTSPTPSQGQ